MSSTPFCIYYSRIGYLYRVENDARSAILAHLLECLKLCTKDEMQGAEDEGEGSVLAYVT